MDGYLDTHFVPCAYLPTHKNDTFSTKVRCAICDTGSKRKGIIYIHIVLARRGFADVAMLRASIPRTKTFNRKYQGKSSVNIIVILSKKCHCSSSAFGISCKRCTSNLTIYQHLAHIHSRIAAGCKRSKFEFKMAVFHCICC
jgi:hypothetical protein